MRRLIWTAMIAGALGGIAVPALADVKAGADAWARGDYRAAVEQWRGPAIAGDAVAQYNLGQAYKLGRGVPVDPALAESWFRKSALQGLPQGVDNYGLALFQADKKADAVPWLEKSVARGEPRAQLVLGTMIFNGDGIARDYPRAYALMLRAAAAGLESAQKTLAQMDEYITPADRERGTALSQTYALQAQALPPSQTSAGSVVTSGPVRVATAKSVKTMPTQASAKPTKQPVLVATKPTPSATPKPATAERAVVASEPQAKRTSAAAPRAVASGRWRIQLGAYTSQANAQAQWNRVRARLTGAQPSYVRAGPIIRLQAGPYTGKADAQRACAASGTACVVVAP